MDLTELTKEIIAGNRLTREDSATVSGKLTAQLSGSGKTIDLSIFETAELDELTAGAHQIRTTFLGKETDTCTIISGISGNCPENCRFCAQSAHNDTGCSIHSLLSETVIMQQARSDQSEGTARFSIVNSGRAPSDEDFEKLTEIYKKLSTSLSISLCASLGFLSEKQWHRLKKAGVKRAHINIETSENFFKNICTTHTFSDKLDNIKRARAAGLEICSGGIIGMGESWQDRIDMAFTLSEIGILSIPINTLIPVKGTPLEKLPRLTEEEILRSIAIFRYINPHAHIRLAGGRALMSDNGRRAFTSGASAMITGNMLTTSGSTITSDLEMLCELGLEHRVM